MCFLRLQNLVQRFLRQPDAVNARAVLDVVELGDILPIGSVWVTVGAVNPAAQLGFGTWSLLGTWQATQAT
jgi:hypothetical protein